MYGGPYGVSVTTLTETLYGVPSAVSVYGEHTHEELVPVNRFIHASPSSLAHGSSWHKNNNRGNQEAPKFRILSPLPWVLASQSEQSELSLEYGKGEEALD